MRANWTLTECFGHFNTRSANTRRGWSARDDLEWGRRRPGNRERLANLRRAEKYASGRFRTVIVTCERTDAFLRRIVRRAIPILRW